MVKFDKIGYFMNIDIKTIDDGLLFYGIDDIKYKNKCHECVKFVNKNETLKFKVIEIYKIIFTDKTDKIRFLWNNKNLCDLFGNNYHPFITNVLLLSGYKIHKDNMFKYCLDEYQINVHKKRVKNTLTDDIYKRHYEGIRISQIL